MIPMSIDSLLLRHFSTTLESHLLERLQVLEAKKEDLIKLLEQDPLVEQRRSELLTLESRLKAIWAELAPLGRESLASFDLVVADEWDDATDETWAGDFDGLDWPLPGGGGSRRGGGESSSSSAGGKRASPPRPQGQKKSFNKQ
eukprot:GABV01001087.1.p2 GENE.GABV01001087.1~~GABV01001087.1.p2  ORF type:complete len:144 (-),score=51.51 GABV01001087.1:424-855(-)